MLIHLPFADAAYRVEPITQRCQYDSEAAIFGPVREADIVERVAEALQSKLRLAGSSVRVFVPLTAGQHVDHVITRAAAERLKIDLDYYEDYPYAGQPDRLQPAWGNAEWRSEAVELSEDALQARIDAWLCHRSQISTFYRDGDEAAHSIRAYASAVGQGQPVERFWRPR
ncbi:MAG: hypothetical protein HY870_00380 [Chloroflexi bacterium]|nr:hypothetical protein [Chloroflexota bacterium]